jgi:DNA-directed RNA polymerase subunit F
LIQAFTLKAKFLVLLLGICFSMVLFNTDNFYNVKLYGHLFTPNETATFVAILDQMQTELKLVIANLANNNVSLAQNHANKTASLLSPKIWFEIAEDNPGLASDLRRAVNQLQNVSASSESQLKRISELVDDLNKRLEENAMVRIGQVQPSSSNFLEALKSLASIFGGNDEEPDQNTELQALAFADVIDAVLINYGNAFGVEFDMTNMSNMDMTNMSNMDMLGNNSGSSSIAANNYDMESMNMTPAGGMNMAGHMKSIYSLTDMTDYQSAQGLATKAFDIFSSKLKPMTMKSNYTSSFVANLEKGLTKLNTSISNKDSPMEIMMIAHTQIHPNLLAIFNLDLPDT